ncbi:MAG: BON domain-containing protein [Bryobacteraceae bacterium]
MKKAILTMILAAAAMAESTTATTELARTRDEALAKKVRHELVTLPFLGVFDNMSFRVEDGAVTLFGQVTRPTLKSDAFNVVRRLEGVAKVENRIEVLPLSPNDNRIRVAVLRAVYGFPSLQRYGLGTNPSIRIIVKNGDVTLEGVVANSGDRDVANIQANAVAGVFQVTNNLRVEGRS